VNGLVFEACSDARFCASVELDDELSELEAARLRAHLRTCPVCAQWVVQAGTLTTFLRDAPVEQTAPIRIKRLRWTKRLNAVAVAGVAASVVALLLAVRAVSVPAVGPESATQSPEARSASWVNGCSACEVGRGFAHERARPSSVVFRPTARNYPEPT
jgi:predicted anti-sigma-YlaC factor YlaD